MKLHIPKPEHSNDVLSLSSTYTGMPDTVIIYNEGQPLVAYIPHDAMIDKDVYGEHYKVQVYWDYNRIGDAKIYIQQRKKWYGDKYIVATSAVFTDVD